MSLPTKAPSATEERVPGLYFLEGGGVSDWVGPLPVSQQPRAIGAALHVFTDVEGRADHIRQRLLAMIAAADRKVLFCSFLFADERIVDALCAAAERLHGGVYIVTALERDLQADTSDLGEEIPRMRMIQERHDAHLRRLGRAGAWLRSADCHAKFCVVDDTIAMVTSANATEAAYEKNPENGLLFAAPEIARELGRLFAHIFLHRGTLESPPGADFHVGAMRPPAKRPRWHPLSGTPALRPICTLGSDERSLQARTIALIDSADRELVIASYSLVALEKHPVGAALRRALVEREVKLLLVLQARNDHAKQRAACAWLVDGVPEAQWCLRGHPRAHAKAMVADGERALLWTGNLDGEHGYGSDAKGHTDEDVEVGVETDDAPLAGVVRDYLLALAVSSPMAGRLRPTREEIGSILSRKPPPPLIQPRNPRR